MGWWLAILSTLMVVLMGGVAVLLVWVHRILEGVTSIEVYLDDAGEQMAFDETTQNGELVSPDSLPMSRHLHDVIAQPPPNDDGKVGEFRGHLPWTPPPDNSNLE